MPGRSRPDLSLDDQRVDHPPGIFDADVSADVKVAGGHVDLDHRGLGPAAKVPRIGS